MEAPSIDHGVALLRTALTMPTPAPGSVCANPGSFLLEIARMAWYASIYAESPAHEKFLLAGGGHVHYAIGEVDESMFDDDLSSYVANLKTGWLERRDKLFAEIGSVFLDMHLADYAKHMRGANDEERRRKSSITEESQLRTCFGKDEQDSLCSRVLHNHILQELSDAIEGEAYSSLDASTDPDLFIATIKKIRGRNTARVEARLTGPVGYDSGRPVESFYLQVDFTSAQYHIIPAVFDAAQQDRAFLAAYY